MRLGLGAYFSSLPGRFSKTSKVSYHVKVPGKPGQDAEFATRNLARIHKKSLASSKARHKAIIIYHEISREGMIVDREIS